MPLLVKHKGIEAQPYAWAITEIFEVLQKSKEFKVLSKVKTMDRRNIAASGFELTNLASHCLFMVFRLSSYCSSKLGCKVEIFLFKGNTDFHDLSIEIACSSSMKIVKNNNLCIVSLKFAMMLLYKRIYHLMCLSIIFWIYEVRFDEITLHVLKFYNLLLLDMYTDIYMHTHNL